jgi:hypothetical protein
LDSAWDAAFPGANPDGGRIRGSERWARFHIRGADDEASDAEALRVLRGLLDDLRGGDESPVRVLATDYGARDLSGGWSKRMPVDLFPWRRWRDEPGMPHFFTWASEPLPLSAQLQPVLMCAVQEDGYPIVTDADVTWAFCPYFAGVDIVFPDTEQRERYVATHASLFAEGVPGA